MKIIIAFLIPAVFSLMTNRDAWEGDQAIPQRIWDHRGSVMAVAFTPDGIQVVTGGAAQTDSVVFWDLKTGQRLHRLQDAGLVYSLALSSDGKKIVTGGMIGIGVNPQAKMAVWDAVTGKELFTLKVGNPGPQPCVAFSPDGKFVATGTVTSAAEKSVGSVQLWDANTGKEAGLFLGLSEGFSQLQFSPDGRTLAAASWGAQTHVVLWEVATRKQRGVLKISKSWSLIRSLAFSADGKLLAWVTGNPVEGAVEHVLWDLTTLRRIAPLRSDELMSFVTFSRTGKSLISVEMEGNFQLWDLATCKKTAGFEVNLDFPTLAHAAAVSPDGTTLVIGTGTPGVLAPPSPTVGTVRIFDVATGRERLSPEKEKQRAKNEAAETARLAAAAKAEALRKQKQAKLEPALQAQVEQSARAALLLQYAVHLNQAQQAIERGQFAVAKKLLQAYLPKAKEHDLRGFEWHFLWRQCQYSLTPLEHQEKVCDGFRGAHPLLSADGKTLAVETEDHAVTLWDMESGKRRVILQGATGPIHNFVFSPNGKLLVTAGGAYPSALHPVYRINQEVPPFVRRGIVWEVNSGKRLADFEVTKKLNTCGAFSPDSKMLAIGDEDGTIYLWEISSQKVRSSLAGKQLPAAMTFSPDGAMLAVGGLNGALCLWDVTTGKETLLDTNNAKQQINSLLFSSDGKNLYSTEGAWSNDYVAKRWKSDDKEKWALQHEWKLVSRIALSPDCKRLALSGWHGVALWDVVEDREVARLLPRVSGDGFVSLLAFSPDSKLLLVQADAIRGQPQLALFDASSGARVGLAHDLLSGTPVRIIVENGGKITALALGGPKGFPDAVDVLRTALGEITRGRIFAVEGPHGIPALAF
ncbi:MAG TPA: hypothetical protein VE988_08175, partial [Gemmataceae bacterium]|nr:hypothetical protein [Gemmataceae bacterium]